jgi:hypothetical protein
VAALHLKRGIANALQAKLDAAMSSVNRRRTGAACGSLAAFVSQVNALSGQQIPSSSASRLRADATRIQMVLACK